MNKRQSVAGIQHYTFDDATIKTLNAFFEEPDSDEGCLSKEEYLEALARG